MSKIALPDGRIMSKALAKRGRGRPKRKATRDAFRAGDLARDSILERALDLTRTEPLSSISMVRLAKSLNVRAGTIHYHLGSRDALVSGVMNRFYRGLLRDLEAAAPAPTWQEEVRRGKEFGLECVDSIEDKTEISCFQRGELPHWSGINTFLRAPYLEDVKEVVKEVFFERLHENLVAQLRPKARIAINPPPK